MNKRTFLKTLGVGSAAAVAVPLSLFANAPKPDPFNVKTVRFMGADWIPTRISLDAIIEAMVESRPNIYAAIIEYHDELPCSGLKNVHAWQVEEVYCKKEDAHLVPTKEHWNGALLFDSFFNTPERELLNKNRYYVAFLPVNPKPNP